MDESLSWMQVVLAEAQQAVNSGVYPYPGVGCILVYDHKIIARARNGKAGAPHAESQVLDAAVRSGFPLAQCALYTNLEPCCNVGLVHSCVKDIIQAGVKEIHVAHLDPYFRIRGNGIDELKRAGLELVLGELEAEARYMNHAYLSRFCPHCGWPVKD